jgi:hypothetical protein
LAHEKDGASHLLLYLYGNIPGLRVRVRVDDFSSLLGIMPNIRVLKMMMVHLTYYFACVEICLACACMRFCFGFGNQRGHYKVFYVNKE